jgi:short subunit dehydrogenase-like uncharacterized protein
VVEACLREKCHYLDITGEVGVFERIYECDFRAKTVGVTLLPGVGFDVIPTDCVALSLKEELPSATHLELAFYAQGKISHGTLMTIIENLPQGSLIRENGAVQSSVSGSVTREIEFVENKRQYCVSIPWGDIASAFRSTQIPNIVVYTAVPPSSAYLTKIMNVARPILGTKLIKEGLGMLVDAFVDGPSENDRKVGRSTVWGEARDRDGAVVQALAKTCDSYELTAVGAVEAVQRVLKGTIPAGALTPALAFGSGFLGELNKDFAVKCTRIA